MSHLSVEQGLIQEFFEALALHHLQRCQELLSQLKARLQHAPEFAVWCDYFSGVMAYVQDRDWATAERIFTGLLQRPELPDLLHGRLLNSLGITYYAQGRWSQAIQTLEAALPVFARLQLSIDQIKVLYNLMAAYQRGYTRGDLEAALLHKALAHGQSALQIAATLTEATTQSLHWVGSVHNNLGLLYKCLGKWEQAIDCYQADLAICRQLENRYGMGLSYGNLGEIYQRQGANSWAQADEAYQQAWRLIHEFGDLYEEVEVLTNLGGLQRDMGEHEQALRYYEQALTLIESLRAGVSAEDARTGFFATVVGVYDDAIQVCLQTKRIGQAFDLVERARSRAFIELLAQNPVRPPQQLPTPLLQQEQSLRAELARLYAEAEPDRQQIAHLEQRWESCQRQLRLLAAEYADLHTVQPLTTTEVQARLPACTALLAYFCTRNQIFAFVVTSNQVSVYPLALTPQQLRRLFDASGHLQRLLPGAGGKLHKPWSLERLYEFLISPCVAALQGKEILYIAPHDALHYVPFQALTTLDKAGRPQTLADEFEILYTPSATVLLEYCQQKQPTSNTVGLALGYNSGSLRHAEAEATAIAHLMQGDLLTQGNATRQALLQQAKSARWLHFSCHGRFNAHAPLTSHLALADGALYAADILQSLSLQAELVTLSACETGRSQVLKGDELIGLVRAFIYAGAPSVLVSLWPVDEVSTRIFMEFFYRTWLAGASKPAALRQAQAYLRTRSPQDVEAILRGYEIADPAAYVARLVAFAESEQVFAHPYFWAPFILIGDRL